MSARRPRPRRRPIRPWQAALTVVVSVVVFLGLLEAGLALVGVEPGLRTDDPFAGFAGYVPLFVEQRGDDGVAVRVTAANKLRFFNRQSFPGRKPPGTFRIFCLGGSTTYGRPYDDRTSFAGWLRELLAEADPARSWEVINAGGISYASYRVARVMRELSAYESDLFVVYTGHNEFLEERTYSGLRDLPESVRGTSAIFARTRTWTAMSRLLLRAGESSADGGARRVQLPDEVSPMLERFEGLDAYERDDALRDGVLLHYRASLERMVRIARGAGAGVIFVVPASSLAGTSPFKSQHTDGLDAAGRERSGRLLAAARAHDRAGRPEQALQLLEQAIALDPRFALLHYRRGRALMKLGRYDEAAAALGRARDEDVCPLRALSSMGRIVVEVAESHAAPRIDFPTLIGDRLENELGHRIPGDESFLDHVHPDVDTHGALALALLEAMAARGLVEPSAGWGTESIARVAERIGAGIDRRAHARAMANLAQVLFWAGKGDEARRPAERALDSGVADPAVVVTSARVLGALSAAEGDAASARRLFRRALHADPGNSETHFQIGLMYLNEPHRELERAAAHLLLTLALWPDNDMAHQTFGLVLAERGRYELALASLRRAEALAPGNPDVAWALIRLRERLGDGARRPRARKVHVARFPSGAPREVFQYLDASGGGPTPDGVWTAWHEGGELAAFADFVDGVREGLEVHWNPDGRRVTRGESPAPR